MRMKRSRFFERVLTGLVVVMALIGVFGTVGVTSAYADEEVTAPQFTKTMTPNDDGTYTTSYTVTKTWDDSDNAQGTRSDSLAVTLEYSVDGGTTWKAYGDKVTLTQAADGTWSYTFTNLPMFNSDGSEIMYRAAEDTDRASSASLFKHFLTFFNVGDRSWAISQNVMVGGKALDGTDLTNPTSYALLDAYFEEGATPAIRRSFEAMKAASALREAMWAMVSDAHLHVPGADYKAHARDYLHRFEALAAR